MEKGIVSMYIPINCFECKFKKRPFGMSFPEDMICGITEESIFQYKPHNINGKKPEWCPIKEIETKSEKHRYSLLFDENETRVKTIRFLREIVVCASLMDCKRALEKNEWDITKAIKFLINRPLREV